LPLGEKNRIFVLALVMALIVIFAVAMTAAALYRVALHEQEERLRETAQSRAHLMAAIAEHELAHRREGTSTNADESLLDQTLDILTSAHEKFKGFGKTGEFALGRRKGDDIVFLLRHRHYDLDKPFPIPFSSNLGEPMRRALSGKSGTDICLDYRGERVVAAYEPVPELGLGLVAKIDLAEVRAPFIRAGLLTGASSLVLIGVGIFLFLRIGNPIVQRLEENERKYRTLSEDLDKEVKRKVAELQQAEHMAAIGKMVSVVSHEMRNPLQHIRLGIETLQMYVGDDRDKIEIMEEIQHGITILDQIVGELLEYSRRVSLNYSSVQYGPLVKQTLSLLSHKLDGIAVDVELESEEREIAVDPVKMSQVLVNVISNGIEAMNSGGNIRISSKFLKLDGTEYLEISISDNGSGMSEEILERIEEPFFTTKISGTGLGIPICRKIIDAHKGSLNVRSKPGDGTTVVITLPV
jgi:signal transduction histidine kinase